MKAVAVRSRIQLKNILFATDFSHAAASALPFAAEIAQRFGARLFAMHAKTPENYALPTSEVLPTFMDERRTILRVIRPLSGHTLRCNKAMSASSVRIALRQKPVLTLFCRREQSAELRALP